MRAWGLTILLSLGLTALAFGAESETRISPKPIRDGVRSAIEGQLAALRDENFTVAYQYAARAIRRQFDERIFELMIRRGYPALLRYESVDIGIVRDDRAGEAQVVVTVTDGVKRHTIYRFWLVEEEKGWRVTGVVLEQKPPHGDI